MRFATAQTRVCRLSGDSRAIICPDAKAKQRIDRLKNFGYASEMKVVANGGNHKMNEIQAAFGLLQLRHIDDAIARRGRIGAAYREALADVPGITCLGNLPDVEANHSYFPIIVGDEFGLSRDALHARLQDEGIVARRYFCPLISDMPMYRDLPSAKQDMPVARKMAQQILCLPIYPDLALETVALTAAIIAGVGPTAGPSGARPDRQRGGM